MIKGEFSPAMRVVLEEGLANDDCGGGGAVMQPRTLSHNRCEEIIVLLLVSYLPGWLAVR